MQVWTFLFHNIFNELIYTRGHLVVGSHHLCLLPINRRPAILLPGLNVHYLQSSGVSPVLSFFNHSCCFTGARMVIPPLFLGRTNVSDYHSQVLQLSILRGLYFSTCLRLVPSSLCGLQQVFSWWTSDLSFLQSNVLLVKLNLQFTEPLSSVTLGPPQLPAFL